MSYFPTTAVSSLYDHQPITPSSFTASRSSSFHSTTTTPTRRPSAEDLSSAARTIIESLSSYDSDDEDMAIISTLTALISPDLHTHHNDQPVLTSRDAYLESWRRRVSSSRGDGLRITVKEACVDESQSKVWVRSEIETVPSEASVLTGGGGGAAADGLVIKEAVDMMTFDVEGVLISKVGFERRVRRRSVDEDED